MIIKVMNRLNRRRDKKTVEAEMKKAEKKRLTRRAKTDRMFAARTPNLLVVTSIRRKTSQEKRMPHSRASQVVPVSMLLLASRFIATTDTAKRAVMTDGTLRNNSLVSVNRDLSFVTIGDPPCFLFEMVKQGTSL